MQTHAIAQILDEQQVREALKPDEYLNSAKAGVDSMVKQARSVLRTRTST
jgi:hypothetical protein